MNREGLLGVTGLLAWLVSFHACASSDKTGFDAPASTDTFEPCYYYCGDADVASHPGSEYVEPALDAWPIDDFNTTPTNAPTPTGIRSAPRGNGIPYQ